MIEGVLALAGTLDFLVFAILSGETLSHFSVAGTPAPGAPVAGISSLEVQVG